MPTLDTKNRYKYSVYGLILEANRTLTELPQANKDAEVDVVVDFCGEEASALPLAVDNVKSGLDLISEGDTDYYHFWFRGHGSMDFKVNSSGTYISASWTLGVIAEVNSLLYGQILGCTLRLRGNLCLHACVIKIDDFAIAIVGESGAGKSTMAAALAQQGHAILADDVAVFKEESGHFSIQPGYPRLRMWPKSIKALYGSESGLDKIFSFSEKRFLDLNDQDGESEWQFYRQPLPVAAIYVLDKRSTEVSTPRIETVPPTLATMNLMNNRSASHLKLDLDRQAQEFAGFGRIAAKVPVKKIIRSDDLTALPQICAVIEKDVTNLVDRGANKATS